MKTLKRFLSLLPFLLLWAMISGFVWSYVFTFLTDTDEAHKVTVFIDAPQVESVALAARLEENLPEGIRMVKVHPFHYAMLDTAPLEHADLYIVPASDLATYQDWFTGDSIQVWDQESGTGVAGAYIQYLDEDYYLLMGAGGYHLDDGAAVVIRDTLLTLTNE